MGGVEWGSLFVAVGEPPTRTRCRIAPHRRKPGARAANERAAASGGCVGVWGDRVVGPVGACETASRGGAPPRRPLVVVVPAAMRRCASSPWWAARGRRRTRAEMKLLRSPAPAAHVRRGVAPAPGEREANGKLRGHDAHIARPASPPTTM